MLASYHLMNEIQQSSGDDKLTAMRKLEQYLKGNEDRTFIDAWSTLGWTQLELGFKEQAVATYKKVLQISPRMLNYFKHRIEKKELPREILE